MVPDSLSEVGFFEREGFSGSSEMLFLLEFFLIDCFELGIER
jgi:hypothetical protein